jgi:hypothetical protein
MDGTNTMSQQTTMTHSMGDKLFEGMNRDSSISPARTSASR